MATKKQQTESEESAKKDTFSNRKYLYAVGRRKEAVAQVRVYEKGKGVVVVNRKPLEKFFPYFEYQQIVNAPFEEIGRAGKFDVSAKVLGGGSRGQAESVRLGIARALVELDADLRKPLKAKGFLKRDPRVKERKKPGLKRARRGPQWRKR